jgi:sigma-B regulation protein RsbU (phosphoserine phosphatase)
MSEVLGKIAVVDDDEMVRGVIASVLESRFEVVTYEKAETFLASPLFSSFSAVITDVSLPGLSGIDMMNEVHARDESVPVIVITGFGDVDTAISALKSGAFDFIIKPFNVEQVLASAGKAVERSHLHRENARLVSELKEKNVQLQHLYTQINERNIQMERDLDIAGNLQECLFPAVVPSIDGVDFSLRMKPADKISGDFFDVTMIGERKFRVIFSDVSGHGVPAALYSAMIKSAITSLEGGNLSPSESLSEINRYLIHSQKRMSFSYATIFIAFINLETKTMVYSNAGIPAPVVLRDGEDRRVLEANGPFVGIFENAVYLDESVSLISKDRFLLFTDGVFESVGDRDADFGYNRLLDFIGACRGGTLENMVEMMYQRAIDPGNRSLRDDLTVLGMSLS